MDLFQTHKKHVDVIKKPIEFLNFNQRFKIHFNNLCKMNESKEDFVSSVYIEILDDSNSKNNFKCFYDNLTEEQLSYIEHLQVIDYTEETISIGVLENGSQNSLKNGMDCYKKIYHYRLKYLPKYYINHPFYRHGYITSIIYDYVISDDTKSACTIIGTEAHNKLIKYIDKRKSSNEILKKVYAKCADEIKSDNEKLLIEFMSDLCGKPVGIRPCMETKDRVYWYIIYVK